MFPGARGFKPMSMNMEMKTDRSCRLLALRGLLNKLPNVNFAVLKFIFQHFVRFIFILFELVIITLDSVGIS